MTRTVICTDDTPTFLHAPMFITKGMTYSVTPCPETDTVLVSNPDPEVIHEVKRENGDYVLTGRVELKRRDPVRYLAERFKEV